MSKFKYLFEPRSVAVVGVSEDAARPGSQAVRALLKYGYSGKIFPVNPKYREFDALKCYGSIGEIEGDVDLVVIGVPAQGVLPVLEDCAKKRVPFAVVLSGGFRESGPEGVERERRMLAIAKSANMRIIGPNCLGFANVHANVYAAFGSITREPKLDARLRVPCHSERRFRLQHRAGLRRGGRWIPPCDCDRKRERREHRRAHRCIAR